MYGENTLRCLPSHIYLNILLRVAYTSAAGPHQLGSELILSEDTADIFG